MQVKEQHPTWEQISAILLAACEEFQVRHAALLDASVNERSMTHKFAEIMSRHFAALDGRWDVDCEYNRDMGDPKRVTWTEVEALDSDDLEARTIYPDIIVHERLTRSNLLIVEAKRNREDDPKDIAKILALMRDPRFGYRYGVTLTFTTSPLRRVAFTRRRLPS